MRKTLDISGDTWLEALKFLTCPQWSQKRYVSRYINGIAQQSISRLPKMVVDSAAVYNDYCHRSQELKKFLSNYTIVALDTVMQKKQSTQWFMERGFTLDAPVKIPAENALISARKWNRTYRSNVNVCILGSAQVKIPLSDDEKHFPWFYELPYQEKFRKPVLYYAQFNPVINQYSWDYLAQFLKIVYYPASYIKDVNMFAVNQNFVDFLKINIDSFDNEPRYIRCESFQLNRILSGEVRAKTIRFPLTCAKTDYDLLANFLIDPSEARQCASKEITICVAYGVAFLNILIQKIHTNPLAEGAIPTIVFSYPHREELPAHLGPNLIDQEVDSQGADALYMISNGHNRMRISFCWDNYYNNYCYVSIYAI